MPRSALPFAVAAAVPPVLQRPPGGAEASVAAAAGSRGWFCLRVVGLVFLSKAEGRFCRVRQALQGRVSSGCEAVSGNGGSSPGRSTQRGQGAGNTLRENGQGERKKRKTTKVSLQVLNFTLSRSNHFAKYKHIFSHIQTAKYSVIFTFHYSA